MNEDVINLIYNSENIWNTIELCEWTTGENDIDFIIKSLEQLKNSFIKYKSNYSHKY